MDEICLALGGGGVKGIAHLGVIRVLEEQGFVIRAIAGTSAGGLVGALVASGYTSAQIENLLTHLANPRIFSRGPNEGAALLGLHGLNQILLDEIGERTFEQLAFPFACTAVDLHTSQEVILANGPLVDAVMATIAVPGVFPPKTIGGYLLVDGAVLDPVPVALARWLAPSLPIIAVCLHSAPEKWADIPSRLSFPEVAPIPRPLLDQFTRMRVGQALEIFVNSIDITSRMLAELRMRQDHPDVIIRPDVEQFGMLDNVNPQELIKIGEDAARAALPEIRTVLTWSNQLSRLFRRAVPPGMVLPTGNE
jgi:NTE family protein